MKKPPKTIRKNLAERAVVWYAKGGHIVRMGPYATQVEAAAATITTKGYPIEGAFVWPEVRR